MSKISIVDWDEFVAAGKPARDAAEAAGQTEFDLNEAAEAKYAAAKSELQEALDAAKAQGQ